MNGWMTIPLLLPISPTTAAGQNAAASVLTEARFEHPGGAYA
jgi:hypothetical protein